MIAKNNYPKSPTIPEGLTKLPNTYKFKAFFAIVAIVLFFALYSSLVVALFYLTKLAITYPMGSINKITVLLKIGAIAGAGMLFVFTLKFVFKLRNPARTNRLKLDSNTHPELWSFVHQICAETGAPKPKNIYVDPDVNAYVSYSNMWLSLLLPIKKELTIGIGLIDSLNLSEFKAVISHEFGHFAQKSMKIGSYIHSANTIIHGMIYDRDSWDSALESWRASDIRLSLAAWLITPVIWVIRQTLALFYQLLNIMYSSLSREMEFNADKVAISTSGSDAIISALWKLDSGFDYWNQTLNHAYLALSKEVYSENLYVHNQKLHEEHLPHQQKKLDELQAHPLGGIAYFTTTSTSKVGMYASHPPNDHRQESAKLPYIACEQDLRSPWILFSNPVQLQQTVTALVYKEYLQKSPTEFSSPEDFEHFITQEKLGDDLLQEYHHTFAERHLHLEPIETLLSTSDAITAVSATTITDLKEELKKRMQPFQEIGILIEQAVAIAQGTATSSSFHFQQKEYTKKTVEEGYLKLLEERERILQEDFKQWDIDFCVIHLHLATRFDSRADLLHLYEQHAYFTELYSTVNRSKMTIMSAFQELQEQGQFEEGDQVKFSNLVREVVSLLNKCIQKIDTLNFSPLPNIETKQELKTLVQPSGELVVESGNVFENQRLENCIQHIEKAIHSCHRIEQKSIVRILSHHKKLHEQLRASCVDQVV